LSRDYVKLLRFAGSLMIVLVYTSPLNETTFLKLSFLGPDFVSMNSISFTFLGSSISFIKDVYSFLKGFYSSLLVSSSFYVKSSVYGIEILFSGGDSAGSAFLICCLDSSTYLSLLLLFCGFGKLS
jgi:hypothetical protein